MKVVTKDILSVLSKVKPGLAKIGLVEQFMHFLFTGEDVITYSDKISVSHPFQSDVVCSVRAVELYKIILGISEPEFDMTLEGDKLRIKAKGTRASITISFDQQSIDLVKSFELKKVDWSPLPDNFNKGILLCTFSASRDVSQSFLHCILVKGDKLVSSDNLRVSRFILNGRIKGKYLLPLSSAIELGKFNVIEYNVAHSWVHFRDADGVMFTSRIVLGEYPNVDSFFDVVDTGVEMIIPAQLKDILDTMTVMTGDQSVLDKNVSLSVIKGKMICRGESKIGWLEKEIEIAYTGEEFSFDVNPFFFFQVLELDGISKMSLFGDRALFIHESFQHIMALPI